MSARTAALAALVLFSFASAAPAHGQGQVIARFGDVADGVRPRREMAPAFEEQRANDIQGTLERPSDAEFSASLHNTGNKAYSVSVRLMQFDADGHGLGSVGFSAQLSPGQRVTRTLQAAGGVVRAELRVERSTPLG